MLDLETVDDEGSPDASIERGGVVVTGTDASGDELVDLVRHDLDQLCRLACSVLVEEGVERGRLDIHLVTSDVIAELNSEHLGEDGPTDVLSFPLNPDEFVAPSATADQPALLGDVVLCPAIALAQAHTHTGSFDSELSLLVIHGVLHILGHDHGNPAEAALMQGRERVHLDPLGFAHPVPEQ